MKRCPLPRDYLQVPHLPPALQCPQRLQFVQTLQGVAPEQAAEPGSPQHEPLDEALARWIPNPALPMTATEARMRIAFIVICGCGPEHRSRFCSGRGRRLSRPNTSTTEVPSPRARCKGSRFRATNNCSRNCRRGRCDSDRPRTSRRCENAPGRSGHRLPDGRCNRCNVSRSTNRCK